jgi:hypothetical protein
MSPEVIPFARSAQGGHGDNSQLDKAGRTILQLLNKAADVAEHAKAFTPASGLPRIALESLRPRLKHTGSKPSARSNGSTRSIRKSRTAF